MVRKKGMLPHTACVSARELLIFHSESTWCEPRFHRNLFMHPLSHPLTIPYRLHYCSATNKSSPYIHLHTAVIFISDSYTTRKLKTELIMFSTIYSKLTCICYKLIAHEVVIIHLYHYIAQYLVLSHRKGVLNTKEFSYKIRIPTLLKTEEQNTFSAKCFSAISKKGNSINRLW
jgi:hypothetical protein